MGETEGIISLVDHQVLVSSYVFVIAGERITQRSKNVVLKIWQCVKNKGKQRELSDHWKSINDPKKTKRLTEMQVLTKRFYIPQNQIQVFTKKRSNKVS